MKQLLKFRAVIVALSFVLLWLSGWLGSRSAVRNKIWTPRVLIAASSPN
jgi:ABC-type transport system involved in cytochrome bd biosynthesis fused ATPase/permease subunit